MAEQDQHGTLSTMVSPAEAVDAEVARLVQTAESEVNGGYRAWAYRIIRDAVPGMTRDRWRQLAGQDPDISQDRADIRAAEAQLRADRALLQRHGHTYCCNDCDRHTIARLRALEAEQGTTPPPAPVPVPAERTCACDSCTDDACQGDCERCDDHGCEQCYDGHTVYGCCGYCEDCDEHVTDDGDDRCTRCNHCRECDHYCP